jgi:hypothetical protein
MLPAHGAEALFFLFIAAKLIRWIVVTVAEGDYIPSSSLELEHDVATAIAMERGEHVVPQSGAPHVAPDGTVPPAGSSPAPQ